MSIFYEIEFAKLIIRHQLISCGARLAPFDIKELRDLTSYDELELDMLGDEKTALFGKRLITRRLVYN